jgi:hypothetical protein
MTYSLDLPADVITSLRDAARDADISAARTFGFGGSNWGLSRPSGVGVGAKSLVSQDAIHGLAFRQRPGTLALAGGGTPVLADIWRFIVLDGDVQPGDVITSVADSDYEFGIASIEPWYQYERCELERVR